MILLHNVIFYGFILVLMLYILLRHQPSIVRGADEV